MIINHSYLIVFWTPFPMQGTNPYVRYFSSFFQRFGDIQCLYCKNSHDPRSLNLMRQADLVVVTLHQSRRELCALFCKNRIFFSNCIYLITDYIEDDSLSLERISFEFRISPSRLACIPYHPSVRETKKWPDSGLNSHSFRRELGRAGQIMLLALGF